MNIFSLSVSEGIVEEKAGQYKNDSHCCDEIVGGDQTNTESMHNLLRCTIWGNSILKERQICTLEGVNRHHVPG